MRRGGLQMKGANHQGTQMKAKGKGMMMPEMCMSAKDMRGQCGHVGSTKTSSAGGFTASRKKGSVKGT